MRNQREPRLVWRQVCPVDLGALAHLAADVRRAGDDAAHDVAVAIDVLRERVQDDVGAKLRRSHQGGAREGRVDGEARTAVVRDARESGDVRDAQERVRDGLDEQHARGRGLERARHRARVGRVDERDVRALLALETLEERAGRSVRVLLRHDPPAAGEPAAGDVRVRRRHAADEADRALGALDLGERTFESGGRGRAVTAVDVPGALIGEDGVLRRRGVEVERDALDERGDDGIAGSGGQGAGRAYDPRPEALGPAHARSLAPEITKRLVRPGCAPRATWRAR